MKVVVIEDRRAPTVVHMVWYRAGSIDEVNGRTGVAHVLEHLMFKGTRTLAPGEFSRRVAAMGGRENAFTSRDYTGYYQQIHKSRLAEVMSLESDRMANLQITADDFEREIKVVMEERRLRTEDRAQGRVFEQLMAAAFVASPVRAPVIGWMDDLEAMTVEDTRDWYATWYVPNNAILVVAGDVDAQAVFALAQDSYGKIGARPLPARKPQREPDAAGPAPDPRQGTGGESDRAGRIQGAETGRRRDATSNRTRSRCSRLCSTSTRTGASPDRWYAARGSPTRLGSATTWARAVRRCSC